MIESGNKNGRPELEDASNEHDMSHKRDKNSFARFSTVKKAETAFNYRLES